MSTRTTLHVHVVALNEHSPRCQIDGQQVHLSIMENSPRETMVGTISCDDDDDEQLNREMTVTTYWQSHQSQMNHNKSIIPFEIRTHEMNRSQVNFDSSELLCQRFILLFVHK